MSIAIFGLVALGTCHGATLTVQSVVGTKAQWSTPDLQNLRQHNIEVIEHGVTATYQGVSLVDLISDVAAPYDPSFYYLLVESYHHRSVFGWADVSPSSKVKTGYVVMKRDGEWLGDAGSRFALLVLSNKSDFQFIPMVEALRLEPVPGTPGYDFQRERWLESIVRATENIRVGSSRRELEKLFTDQEHRFKGMTRTYFSQESRLVKIDVEFLDDKILKISKPYLGMPYCSVACE